MSYQLRAHRAPPRIGLGLLEGPIVALSRFSGANHFSWLSAEPNTWT